MSTDLKALILLTQHNEIDFDTWISQVLEFDETSLKKAMGTIEYLCEDTYLDIQEKLLEHSQELETAYEDGEIHFPKSQLVKINFWGANMLDYEPSNEEEDYLNKIQKLQDVALYY